MKKEKDFETTLKQFVTSTLRRASLRWKPRSEALRNARTARGLYQCSMCKESFKQRDVAVDHTLPVIDQVRGFTNWDDFIRRLFVPASGMSVLCHTCHDNKTLVEDATRAAFNAERKEKEKQILKEAKKQIKKSGFRPEGQ